MLGKRTHLCGNLSKENIGQQVTLMGWVHKRRDLGGVIFVDLRDRSGIIQFVVNPDKGEAFNIAEQLRSEFVVKVQGKVTKRPEEGINPNVPNGDIEIIVYNLEILNKAETPPFSLDNGDKVDESIRLKYRYLDLRRPSMYRNLALRHKVAKGFRDFLDSMDFIEVETPFLTRSTPEGARDYLVPSRVNPGKFYALPQSPQIFKQLLMVGGIEKYYQIVKCFRDEDLRKDRQPEFTQVDIEMSFVDIDDVIEINEQMMKYIWEKVLGQKISIPFKRLSYEESMDLYGNDKPDTRFEMKLTDISSIVKDSSFKVFSGTVATDGVVKGIKLTNIPLSRREIDGIEDEGKSLGAKGLAWIQLTAEGIKSPIAKFLTEDELSSIIQLFKAEIGDTIFIMADKRFTVNNVLGELRLKLANKYSLIDENKNEFLWIVDFPLLEYDEEEKRFIACHHPFTSPKDSDIELLNTHPGKAKAKAYDLVLNGIEIAGGSIRIYNGDVQEKMFKALGFTKEEAWNRFGFLLEAFKYGTPPHGGIAYGLDRLVMIMAKKESIREVIAFPKTQQAVDPMTQAPSEVSQKQLDELCITTKILKIESDGKLP